MPSICIGQTLILFSAVTGCVFISVLSGIHIGIGISLVRLKIYSETQDLKSISQ